MRSIEIDGPKLLQLRTDAGLTREDLAAAAPCDVKTLWKAENRNGPISLRVAGRIADALNVSFSDIVLASEQLTEQQRNISVVEQWNEAFFARDLELTMSFHHPDVELILPNSEGLPGGGNFHGKDEVRQHLVEVFAALDEYELHDKQIHAAENYVFLRSHASARVIANGQRFGSWYLNEFRLQDGLIVYRTVITDYESFRRGIDDETPEESE